MKLNLRTKLIGGFAIVLLLMVVTIGLIARYTTGHIQNHLESTVEQNVKAANILGVVARRTGFIHTNSLLHLFAVSNDDMDRYESEITDWESKIDGNLDTLVSIFSKESAYVYHRDFYYNNNQIILDKITEFRIALNRYLNIWKEQVAPLSRANRAKEAFGIIRKRGTAGIAARAAMYKLDELHDDIFATADYSLKSTVMDFRKNKIILLISAVLAVMLGLAFGIKLSSQISGAVNTVSKAAQSVANGDLDQHVSVKTGDEIESMAESFNIMTYNMKENTEKLQREISDRERAEKALYKLNLELEERVEKRTAELRDELTERKRAEEAMHEAEEKYREIFENVSEGIYRTTPDGKILLANPALAKMLGYDSPDELKTINVQKEGYKHPADRKKFVELMDKNGQVRGFESKCKKKDGTILFLKENANAVRDENGKILYYDGTIEDITDHVRREEEHRRLEEQFHQSQKMESVGQLAGGIAHDFNNILTIISGYSQLLLDRLDKNTPLRKNVEKIAKAGKQAASLTRQLLAFSRKQVLETKVLDLNVILADVKKMLGRLLGENIELTTVLEPELKQVKADPGQIEQVVMNLVVNARDAMPEGGRITIKTENVTLDKDVCKTIPESSPGKFVCFSIEDNGMGMKKEIIDQIYEPFFTTKKTGEGTGLGLSVVYGIIKQHSGWINVYSEPGKGSVFKIYLPVISVESEEETEAVVSIENLQGNGERILLVEDEEDIRQFAAIALSGNGYKVLEAVNVEEALNLFDKEDGNFDLVFSDVVLPDRTGLRLVNDLLLRKPELRVLLSSGYSDHKSQWAEIKKKGFRFLQKPYAVTDLLETIREVLEQE